jgi:hypothetical protein
MNMTDMETLAKSKLNDPNPIIAKSAAAALAEIQKNRSSTGLAQMYAQASGNTTSSNPSGYMAQLSQMRASSPWAGKRTWEDVDEEAQNFGTVGGQKTWDRQLKEADATGKLNGQWTQQGQINNATLAGKNLDNEAKTIENRYAPQTAQGKIDSQALQNAYQQLVNAGYNKSLAADIAQSYASANASNASAGLSKVQTRNLQNGLSKSGTLSAADQKLVENMGTPEQQANYSAMRDVYANSKKTPQESYQYALTHPQNFYGGKPLSDIGQKLYEKMLGDLKAAADSTAKTTTATAKAGQVDTDNAALAEAQAQMTNGTLKEWFEQNKGSLASDLSTSALSKIISAINSNDYGGN